MEKTKLKKKQKQKQTGKILFFRLAQIHTAKIAAAAVVMAATCFFDRKKYVYGCREKANLPAVQCSMVL